MWIISCECELCELFQHSTWMRITWQFRGWAQLNWERNESVHEVITFTLFTEKICLFEQHVRDQHNTKPNLLLRPVVHQTSTLSLLGHLNFTLRIIPQGRAFISYLPSITSSVPSLLTSISLDSSSLAEIRPWLNLLTNWKWITFFYDNQPTHPQDIHPYINAAS